MKKTLEVADLILKILSCCAIIAGAIWAYFLFEAGGGKDWVNNMSLQAQVLPYHDDLRLLVVHVRSRNPRAIGFEFDGSNGSFELRVRKVPDNLKSGAVLLEDHGEMIAKTSLFSDDGYELLPNGELDDMATVVLPVGIAVAVTAEMKIENGTRTKKGKPDYDVISASTVVRIEP